MKAPSPTYFTIMLRTSSRNIREWYVEEFCVKNCLYPVHKKHGFVFSTFEDAKSGIFEKLKKEHGVYVDRKARGRKKGQKGFKY